MEVFLFFYSDMLNGDIFLAMMTVMQRMKSITFSNVFSIFYLYNTTIKCRAGASEINLKPQFLK